VHPNDQNAAAETFREQIASSIFMYIIMFSQRTIIFRKTFIEKLQKSDLDDLRFSLAKRNIEQLCQPRPTPIAMLQMLQARYEKFDPASAGRRLVQDFTLDGGENLALDAGLAVLLWNMGDSQSWTGESNAELYVNSILVGSGLRYARLVNSYHCLTCTSWGKLNKAEVKPDHFIGFRFFGISLLVPFCVVEVKKDDYPRVKPSSEPSVDMKEGVPHTTTYTDDSKPNCQNDW
jgi:hypothetical protein